MHFVEPSREVLAETLLAAGPDAPTLCKGWRTRDLAAHLYLRERKAAVGLGLIIKRLAKASDAATAKLAAKLTTTEAYAGLVNTFRAGPPALSPMNIKALDESSNLIEYFVHTEDVRRAVDRWAPRALDEAYSDALWDELVKRAAILYRGVDLGIVLVRPSGPRHVAKRAPVSVAIVGEPGELLMHAHGRTRPGSKPTPSGFEVTTHGGRTGTGIDAIAWAKEAADRGVGEILLNSIDADGTKDGFDLEMIRMVRAAVKVPIIASGGAGEPAHFPPAVAAGADAVLAASIFHWGPDNMMHQVKDAIRNAGYAVR